MSFRFRPTKSGFGVGTEKERDEALTDIIFDRRVFWTNLRHNLGLLLRRPIRGAGPVLLPGGVRAAGLRRRHRGGGRRGSISSSLRRFGQIAFVRRSARPTPGTAAGARSAIATSWAPTALFLFLLPLISRLWRCADAVARSAALFTAPLVLNPFVSSFYPGNHAKHGPLRWLPVELTLVYDWPINTDQLAVMLWFGDNARPGRSRISDLLLRRQRLSPRPTRVLGEGESRASSLIKTDRPMKRLVLTLTAGPVPTDVDVTRRPDDRSASLCGRASRSS